MNGNICCWRCNCVTETRNYNIANIHIRCAICGRLNKIYEGLERFYGRTVGKIAREAIEDFERLAGRSKQSVLISAVERASAKINIAIALRESEMEEIYG